MFTGLVQAVGKIHSQGKSVLVEVPASLLPLELGDSISVDGVCLTVAALRDNAFLADVSEETLSKTTLAAKAEEKSFVNLEPALRLSDRLGGHLVSGHIDGLGKVVSVQPLSHSWHLEVCWEDNSFFKYTCPKASIALNGVSLTVAQSEIKESIFSIAIIPHTWEYTSLQNLKKGELINLEADLMAKYAESLLNESTNTFEAPMNLEQKKSHISHDWLIQNGFA